MQDAIADIVRQLLIDLSLGDNGGSGWPIFTGLLPDTPDKAISCYDTAGRFDGREMRTGEQIEHPGIQILVRAPMFTDATKKAKDIALALDEQHNVEVEVDSGRFYILQNISRTGAVLPLGLAEDDRRRYHFSINAVLTLKESE